LSEAASALAYGVEAPPPPPQLRERILDRARAERANVVPLRPRWALPAAAMAVAAVAAAIALAIWASSLSNKVDRLQASSAKQEQIAAILAAPGAQYVGNRGSVLVVTRSGLGALVVRELGPARKGLVYEAWVADHGKPKPAGTFQSKGLLTIVPLKQAVPKGATVLVTREKRPVDSPTTTPFIRVST